MIARLLAFFGVVVDDVEVDAETLEKMVGRSRLDVSIVFVHWPD